MLGRRIPGLDLLTRLLPAVARFAQERLEQAGEPYIPDNDRQAVSRFAGFLKQHPSMPD